ncbi:unknown protein [Simkania negevensis Z]|uniref:Uncharacterized protein n=1 Tax=Simkania negevensis (strain ATCC VR-1471 / DSM 27360 / Z) TaxID=331113 RepID=F8L478_SIMNZ|nr:unknown protein [Simkania negevensis Z]
MLCLKNSSPLLIHLLGPFALSKFRLVTLTMFSILIKQIALKIWLTFDEEFLRQSTSAP